MKVVQCIEGHPNAGGDCGVNLNIPTLSSQHRNRDNLVLETQQSKGLLSGRIYDWGVWWYLTVCYSRNIYGKKDKCNS